jgi:hypothetical protein
MEISRKKITDAEIHEAELKLCNEVTALLDSYFEKFDAIGYELVAEFSRDNENLENEERAAFKEGGLGEACEYEFGYASGVKITVRHKKDEAEEEAEEEFSADGLSEEEAELAENERLFAAAKKEADRDVAFTSMYFVHIYKAFWRESVSISENIDEINADLEEFLSVLTEKTSSDAEENEAE